MDDLMSLPEETADCLSSVHEAVGSFLRKTHDVVLHIATGIHPAHGAKEALEVSLATAIVGLLEDITSRGTSCAGVDCVCQHGAIKGVVSEVGTPHGRLGKGSAGEDKKVEELHLDRE